MLFEQFLYELTNFTNYKKILTKIKLFEAFL